MRNIWMASVAIIAACSTNGLAAEQVVSRQSVHDFSTTVERVEAMSRTKGLTVFARLDHAAAAAAVGQAMPPSTVIVVGNPRIGTQRFIRYPTLAIDLPLKLLVWQDGSGHVRVSYNSARHMVGLGERHGLASSAEVVAQAERTEELMSEIAAAVSR